MSSRDAAKLAPFRQEIEALGRRTCAVAMDVRDGASIKAAVAEVERQMGRIDILVNNAGCNIRKPALDVTWDDVRVAPIRRDALTAAKVPAA